MKKLGHGIVCIAGMSPVDIEAGKTSKHLSYLVQKSISGHIYEIRVRYSERLQ